MSDRCAVLRAMGSAAFHIHGRIVRIAGIVNLFSEHYTSAAAFREAARAFRETTLPALGAIIAEQVGEAIGQPDLAFAFPKQADVGVLSRAIGSLVTAGVPIEQAREIVGL